MNKRISLLFSEYWKFCYLYFNIVLLLVFYHIFVTCNLLQLLHFTRFVACNAYESVILTFVARS